MLDFQRAGAQNFAERVDRDVLCRRRADRRRVFYPPTAALVISRGEIGNRFRLALFLRFECDLNIVRPELTADIRMRTICI